MSTLKVAAVSDLHGNYLPEIPEYCDYLVIAGDLLPDKNQKEYWESCCIPWFKRLEWLRKIFLVGGNHDNYLEQLGAWGLVKESQKYSLSNLVYLQNLLHFEKDFIYEENKEYELKVYGSPCTTGCGYMPFARNTLDFLDSIPQHLDLLITHSAPKMKTTEDIFYEDGTQAGDIKLNKIICQKQPKILVCGHVHCPCIETLDDTLVLNVSRSTRDKILYKPVIINMEV